MLRTRSSCILCGSFVDNDSCIYSVQPCMTFDELLRTKDDNAAVATNAQES